MFTATGNVLCAMCQSAMRTVAIEIMAGAKNKILFECEKCSNALELEYGRSDPNAFDGIFPPKVA